MRNKSKNNIVTRAQWLDSDLRLSIIRRPRASALNESDSHHSETAQLQRQNNEELEIPRAGYQTTQENDQGMSSAHG
tara:strand:+ start:193 stop:423 length:231 start_codon:yes stop_codon:yes gene_type:complete